MKNLHNFFKSLHEGRQWEVRAIIELAKKYEVEGLRQATGDEQRRGIDFFIKFKNEEVEKKVNVKIRDNKYYGKGILIETYSVLEDNVLGWLYKSEADWIYYLWWDSYKTGFMKDKYILQLNKYFIEWFEKNKSKFKNFLTKTIINKKIFHTEFYIIEESQFEKDFLIKV